MYEGFIYILYLFYFIRCIAHNIKENGEMLPLKYGNISLKSLCSEEAYITL